MNIAFDVDGVLTDFEWFLDTYGKRFFQRHTQKTVSIVSRSNSVAERFGYSSEWDRKFYSRYLFWYIRKYPIRENAAEVIRTLRKKGNKVYFVTARALTTRDDLLGKISRKCLLNWLKRNGVEYDGIYHVSVENAAREKKAISENLNIDFFVEDDEKNVQELSKVCNVICMSADYNTRAECYARVLDFSELYWVLEGEHDFRVLNYHEREKLEEAQKKLYAEKLYDYYKSIPFDLEQQKVFARNLCRTLFVLRRLFCFLFPFYIQKGQVFRSYKKVIFVCNHRRALDVPMCYALLNQRCLRILTKREFEATPLGAFMRWLGIIFLNREKGPSRKMVQNIMIQTLINNGNVLLFPEGTRNTTNKSLLPFKMGAVYMAQVTGATIVPVVIRKGKRKYYISLGDEMVIETTDDLEKANEELYKTMERMWETLLPENHI